MAGKVQVFQFSVDGHPSKFTYTPTTDWTYSADDTLRFETASGPFTLDVIRKDATALPHGKHPFHPLQSHKEGDKHVAETKITDGLSKEQRDELRQQHSTVADPFGFIARYRYKIGVTLPGGAHAADDQKNGEYRC